VSDDGIMVTILVGGFFGFLGLVFWLTLRAHRKARENLQEMARALEWEFHAPRRWTELPVVTGARRGKPVKVFSYTTGSGKQRQTWAALVVAPASPTRLTFALSRQGFGARLQEVFGAKEIVVGDPAFDAAWFIQTNDPDFFRAALIPELRARLQAARAEGAKGRFELKDGVVGYVEEGSFYSPARCRRYAKMVDLLCDLADVAEVAGP
jgi:hypothetical protein